MKTKTSFSILINTTILLVVLLPALFSTARASNYVVSTSTQLNDALSGSELNALGGVMANSKGSYVTVTSASDPESAFEIPAGAYDGGTILIKGNVKAGHDTAIQSYGLDSSGKSSTVTVNGDVNSIDEGYSIVADGGGTIVLHGNLQATESGAMAGSGGQITIDGNINCGSGFGVYVYKASTIIVNGVITSPLPITIGKSDLAPTSQIIRDGYTIYASSGDDNSIVKVKIPNSTGIIEKPTDKDFRIFPNPTSGIAQIYKPESESINRLEVFSIQGKQVLFIDHPGDNDLDLSGFPNGIYLLKIQSKSGIFNHKILKH
jgi:hypothetical protein